MARELTTTRGLSDEQKANALSWFKEMCEEYGLDLDAHVRVMAHFPDWQEVFLFDRLDNICGPAAERIDPQRSPRLARIALETRNHSAAIPVAEKIDPVASPDLASLALELNDPPISCRVAEHIDPEQSPDLAAVALGMDPCIARYVAKRVDPQASPELARMALAVAERVDAQIESKASTWGALNASMYRDAVTAGRAVAKKIDLDLDSSQALARQALRSPYSAIALPVAKRIDPVKHHGLAKLALQRVKAVDVGGAISADKAALAVAKRIDPQESPDLARLVLESGLPQLAGHVAAKIDPQQSPDLARLVFNVPVTIKMPFLIRADASRHGVKGRLTSEGLDAARAVAERIDPEAQPELAVAAMELGDPEISYVVAVRVDPTMSTKLDRFLSHHRLPHIDVAPSVENVLAGKAQPPSGARRVTVAPLTLSA